jgi:hypothetical protein
MPEQRKIDSAGWLLFGSRDRMLAAVVWRLHQSVANLHRL